MATEFHGSRTLQPFSPRWTDPDLLEKTLVGRGELVDRLEQLAIEGAGGPNKYQRLLIGPRGSGKTHVLKVLHTRLWRNEPLKERLLIVYLLEDELGVASFLDFLVRLLKAIVAWYPENKQLAQGLDELYDMPASAQQRRAVELLFESAGSRDILILMENLGITFDDVQGFGRKGQQALRDLVQQNPRFLIFASAQALVGGIREAQAPFYQFFKIDYLERLSLDEAMDYLGAVAAAYGNSAVTRFLGTPEGRSRVRAIYEFTGGSHRLLVTFYDFLSADSLVRLSDAFLEALKPLKPYYQEQMRALSSQQQKIVQFLSQERTPRTVKEIARGCMATSNTVSSQMKALLEKGFVARIPEGRETYYEMAEALFRICYEADLDHQGAPVRLFVDFLGNFYTAQELESRARGFGLLAQTIAGEATTHQSEAALYRTALFAYYRRQMDNTSVANPPEEWGRFFADLAAHQSYPEIISFARRLGESKDPSIALLEADAHIKRGDTAEACAVLHHEAEKRPADANIQAKLGAALLKAGDPATAEACCRRALELDPMNAQAREGLVGALIVSERFGEALEELTFIIQSSECPTSLTLLLAGMLKEYFRRTGEAEDAYRRALAQDGSSAVTLQRLGSLLARSGRAQEGIEFMEKAASIESSGPYIQVELGMALLNVENLEGAEAAFRRAVELQSANAAVMLSNLLWKTGRASEAEQILREWTGREPENASVRNALANLLMDSSRPSEALEQVLAVQQIEPGQPEDFFREGVARFAAKDIAGAEAPLRRAIEMNPALSDAWVVLAWVLAKDRRIDEAVALLAGAPEQRGSVRIMIARGNLHTETGDFASASADYEAALAIEPGNAEALLSLSAVLLPQGRIDEAAEVFLRGLADLPSRSSLAVDGVRRNLITLFGFCARTQMGAFLNPVLDAAARGDRLAVFEQAIPLAVFVLLNEQEITSEGRFGNVLWTLENVVTSYVNVSVATLLLSVGIDYFKRGDRKALMRLSREERALFTKELGIEDAA